MTEVLEKLYLPRGVKADEHGAFYRDGPDGQRVYLRIDPIVMPEEPAQPASPVGEQIGKLLTILDTSRGKLNQLSVVATATGLMDLLEQPGATVPDGAWGSISQEHRKGMLGLACAAAVGQI